jgi:F-type H+-transporting ATPase subunit gamma
VQEARAALPGIRQYAEVMEGAIAATTGLPGLPDREASTVGAASDVLIVVCSEHGFTGAFNESMLDRAESELKEGEELGIIGRRGAMLAEERSLDVAWNFPMATHVGGVPAVTRRVAEHLATVSRARIVFGRYRRGRTFEVLALRILPLDPALLRRSEGRNPPLHHLEPQLLLERLAGEYLFAEITRAVMESVASENGARLRVMEAANHNMGDKLDLLRRQEHALRQQTITAELLDVVIGSEAILGASDRRPL